MYNYYESILLEKSNKERTKYVTNISIISRRETVKHNIGVKTSLLLQLTRIEKNQIKKNARRNSYLQSIGNRQIINKQI